MRAACTVVVVVAVAALVATAPHDRAPHRTPHRMPHRAPHRAPHHVLQRRLNGTEASRDPSDQSNHHNKRRLNGTEAFRDPSDQSNHHNKVIHRQKNMRHDAAHHRRNVPQRMSTWKRITDTLAQAFMGYVGDDYDQSSSSDSASDTESISREPQQSNANKHSHFVAMASSALSQLGFANLPKLWQRKKYRKKARAKKAAAKKALGKVSISENVSKNATGEEEKKIKEYGARDGELAVEEGVPIVQQIYKMAGRSDVLRNPLNSLQEIERKVEASGRKLTFIEYMAMLEIMVLAVIAAGVFKSANLPIPIPLLAKT